MDYQKRKKGGRGRSTSDALTKISRAKTTKQNDKKGLRTPSAKSRKKKTKRPERSMDDSDLDMILSVALSPTAAKGSKSKSKKKKRQTMKVISPTPRSKRNKDRDRDRAKTPLPRKRPKIKRDAYSNNHINRNEFKNHKSNTSTHSIQSMGGTHHEHNFSNGSNKSNPNNSPTISNHESIEIKSKWIEKTKQSETELKIANEKITTLAKDKYTLEQELNELKQTISTLKASNDILKSTKEINESEYENKVQQYQYEISQAKDEVKGEIQSVNNQHEQELSELQLVIDNYKFQQLKLKKELEHKDRICQQKLQSMQSQIKGKEQINEQLKKSVSTVQQQLLKQTDLTNQVMNELEETRKSKFGRVPRNNGYVSLRVNSASAGGCCSSWWGKKQRPQGNMDSKYMATDNGYTANMVPSTDYDDYEK
mmetsp:Transcript_18113/g.16201  ORF Transcript_18113/g.16201 Transcript_18113/m.16201 type:complete len:424 (+) Transcript_18113:133-1404(+)|eukprot:CAMPEP_0201587866 /NCGR_PEP_ID=MMETSP0190_2-20130828/148413_1 /ASSEMBLY_ACC=CAM_ASM_000263 /TAXON_ID=37353 /ORGANISM="Rosalina sp." /LENGTH=423 /DNA_ID=CAMNT_0048038781 /DNA_START=132 /DNA_END=1403 /DNA_ORIENTATION=+